MATATAARRSTNVLDQLQELEAAHQTAANATAEAGREHQRKLNRALELLGQRQREITNDPEQVDHHGRAVSETSVVAKIDAKLAELDSTGSVDELAQQLEHARRIEARKRQDVEEFVRQNIDALRDAMRPDAEAVADAVNQAAHAVAATEVERYLAHAGRLESYEAIARTDPGNVARRVPGAEAAHALRKSLAQIDLPTPA